MPIYEYACRSCGHEFEELQKISEKPLVKCPSCRIKSLVKKVSAAGFRLKGGGWYETDFKTKAKKDSDVTQPNLAERIPTQTRAQQKLRRRRMTNRVARINPNQRRMLVQRKRLRKRNLDQLFAVEPDNKRKAMRSHLCGEVKGDCEGKEVEVYGWVHRRRDHGGVIFLDVRDHSGILQVVFDPDSKIVSRWPIR